MTVALTPSPPADAVGGPGPLPSPRRVRPGPGPVFAAVCLVVAVVRFLVLSSQASPAGVDGGNWLAFGQALLGRPVRSSSIVYPPVVPALVTGAVELFGLVRGIAVVGAAASLAPAVATFVVLRKAGLGALAVVLAGLLAAAAASGEPAAWGGYPQLLGTGLAVAAVWLLDRHLRAGGARSALLAGGALAATAATSHLAALVAAVAAAVMVALHLVVVRAHPRVRARGLLVVGSLCLPLAPLYAALVPAVVSGSASRPPYGRLGPADVASELGYVVRDFPLLWWTAVAVAVAAPLVCASRRRDPLWLVVTSMAVAVAVLVPVLRDGRVLYLVPVVAVLALGLVLAPFEGRAALVVGLGVALAVQSVVGLRTFEAQRRTYAVLAPGALSAVRWLGSHAGPRSVIAVTPVHDSPLGWWVEGLTGRPVLPAAALRYLNFPDERSRARLANRIFQGGFTLDFPDSASLDLARRAGVDYLLVAKTWEGYSAVAVERFERAQPGVVVLENGDAVVLRVTVGS